MSASRHNEWLSLVEYSGPFLAVPVLEEVFPQGLEVVETATRQRLRRAYDEWREAVDEADPVLDALHREWINLVLREILEFDPEVLSPVPENGTDLAYTTPAHGVTVRPDLVFRTQEGVRLLIGIYSPETGLDTAARGDGWAASPVERMTSLCRSVGVRLGLVTDGERWVLVNAPVGGTSGATSWYARLWFLEPVTLQAFRSLLGVRRFFGPPEENFEALLERSLEHHEEVTNTLGQQVRRAVEVLVQALDKADEERDRELLQGVQPSELYEAGLTVMMRLVFVLCAEERDLLLSGNPVYDRCYAVSPLRAQLAEEAGRHGPEVLERNHDAWSRLLAVFRGIYGGIEHDGLRLPALGGSLFDPDRFPFLEGRAKGTDWRETPASPLPIDNRTVLLLLSALQVLEQRGGALLLSYKALDVEQIGHVYEGLLEYTVGRAPSTTLGLVGSQKAKNPDVALAELESARLEDERTLVERLIEVTGRSEAALRNALARDTDDTHRAKLHHACGGDISLVERVLPFANLLRTDHWGEPLVYRKGAFAVSLGADRRETGTHYTPKALTEAIVETTLEPLAYVGPAEGLAREEWRLKSPADLLELKICDPAMGSGAFLVQVCRWLAERLVEAWAREEAAGRALTVDGELLDELGGHDPMQKELDDRIVIARRIVAERCLYGVDMNPLAVELAKLSLWLTTLAKGQPFGFLDHNLHCGDSLLGISALDQLTQLTMTPSSDRQSRLFGRNVEGALERAVELRKRLRDRPIHDLRDVVAMAELDAEARRVLDALEHVADALVGAALRSDGKLAALASAADALSLEAQNYLEGDSEAGRAILRRGQATLVAEEGDRSLSPFHWPLEFPEVFARRDSGFDAFVGNPPFLGGKRISTVLGTTYNAFLAAIHPPASKNTDLVAHFFRRAFGLLRPGGNFGLLAVNTIAEGDTRQGGLEWMTRNGATIYAGYPNEPWPGKAAVVTSRVHAHKGDWAGSRQLSGRTVPFISAFLSEQEEWSPKSLEANKNKSFIGSFVNGMGFVLTHEQAQRMLDADPRNAEVVFPYLNGDDLNSDPEQRASRWVINFWDWPEGKAATYRAPYEWLREHVYPERLEKSKQKSYRNIMSMWWQHWNVRSGLYHAIGRGFHFERHPKDFGRFDTSTERVIALTRHSKSLVFSFVDSSIVFSDALVVFALGSGRAFSYLQSAIHGVFAWQHGSRLKNDLRYGPSDIFETFSFPDESRDVDPALESIGGRLSEARKSIMKTEQIGLTPLYRRIHSTVENDPRIGRLRDLHCELDMAVATSYGWNDIDLGHGFHEVPYLPEHDRVRFTISESARAEVLRRLSQLNRQRYEGENAERLHGSIVKLDIRGRASTRSATASSDLFGGRPGQLVETSSSYTLAPADHTAYPRAADSKAAYHAERVETTGSNAAEVVVQYLRATPGWHAKSDIVNATAVTDGQWNAAIKDLVERGLVERKGERRGARYRANNPDGGKR